MPYQIRAQYSCGSHMKRVTRLITLLVILSSILIVLYAIDGGFYSEYRVRRLLEGAYNAQRPGGGRLFGSPYSPMSNQPHLQAELGRLGRAQVLLLRQKNGIARQRLQQMLYLAAGDWQAFRERSGSLPPEYAENPSTLNNLGVSSLALADNDPMYLLNALDEFERAAQLAPKVPEPRYNLV